MIPFPVIVTAVVSSALLALLSMGFTLQYITMGAPNLAYSTITIVSAYAVLTITLLGLNPYIAVPFGFLIGGLLNLMVYKFLAFLRDRGMPATSLMIASLVFVFITAGFMNIYADILSLYFKTFARTFTLVLKDFTVILGDLQVPGILFISIIAAILMVTIFHTLLTKTKFGISMRAIMENPSLASTQGINTELVLSTSWFIVGGIAGIASVLFPLWFTVNLETGLGVFISIFAAVVLGGVNSLYGSLAGGFIIGFSEIFITYAFVSILGGWVWTYRSLSSMTIAATAIFILPKGLSGLFQKLREK